jgi:hypothetical protein
MWNGSTLEEAATALNLKPSSAKTYFQRCKSKLRVGGRDLTALWSKLDALNPAPVAVVPSETSKSVTTATVKAPPKNLRDIRFFDCNRYLTFQVDEDRFKDVLIGELDATSKAKDLNAIISLAIRTSLLTREMLPTIKLEV